MQYQGVMWSGRGTSCKGQWHCHDTSLPPSEGFHLLQQLLVGVAIITPTLDLLHSAYMHAGYHVPREDLGDADHSYMQWQ